VSCRFAGAGLHVPVGATIRSICGVRPDDKGFQGGKRDDNYRCAHLGCTPRVCGLVSRCKKRQYSLEE
jgi:hypothetical protein